MHHANLRYKIIPLLVTMFITLVAFTSSAFGVEEIALWREGFAPDGKGGVTDEVASVFVHRPEHPNGTVVIICPGGGYGGLVMKPEGHDIAEWLNGHRITAVVLKYRLPQGRPMVPLLDARRAIQLVRAKAEDWGCDPGKIGIAGFSAGGHLAAMAATDYEKDSRPDFALLVYPVITMGQLSHGGSRKNLLGENPTPELVKNFSAETLVRNETPPVFLAHAVDDKLVPIDNSRLFRDAMAKHAVPCELLELPSGGHGLNGYDGPMWDAWQSDSLKWMTERGFLPKEERANDIVLRPTFKEGFGVVYKKELTIKVRRVKDANKSNSKGKISEDFYYIDDPNNKENIISVECFSSFLEIDIKEAFEKAEEIKVQAILFESLSAEGVPRVGKSITDESLRRARQRGYSPRSIDAGIPSGPGWTINNIFYLMDFSK